ncbi:hypothetical protein LEMLEM_LOCUS16545 [Lemmus lemmus]
MCTSSSSLCSTLYQR